MKIGKIGKCLFCAFLSALFLLSAGCSDTTVPAATTGTPDQTEATTPVTEEPETDPAEETEGPAVMVRISDKLELPQIVKPAEMKSITVNLNSILKNGYGSESLQKEAFDSVFDKIILFKAGKDYDAAYVLGRKTALDIPLLYAEDGNFIALATIAEFIGGEYVSDVKDGKTVSELRFGNNSVVCTDTEALLTADGGEPAAVETRISKIYIQSSDSYADLHYINVKDGA